MESSTATTWSARFTHVLRQYDDALLRRVAGKLCKPRGHWPAEELIERNLEVLANAPVLDRRLKDLSPSARWLLAMLARSRQPRWPLGSLVQLLAMFGVVDTLAVLLELLEAGLMHPDLGDPPLEDLPARPAVKPTVKDFAGWLAVATNARLFLPEPVAERALKPAPTLPLAAPIATEFLPGHVHEADGLEWPLRLGVLWQRVHENPLRRTQQKDFFKRDQERLAGDPLLSAAPTDALTPLPDPGFLMAALGLSAGVVQERDNELHPGDFPASWAQGLPTALADLWARLFEMEGWRPVQGGKIDAIPGNPYPAAYLAVLALLADLPDQAWTQVEGLETWVRQHHPFWAPGGETEETADAGLNGRPQGRGKRSEPATPPAIGIEVFLLGLAFTLRLVHAARVDQGPWCVRLSALGRWILGAGDPPREASGFPQTLLVQPNLEILAFRQGLTPELVARLSRLATWKGLGPACTLQLEPASVYRALEAGETLESITQVLVRHGTKALPPTVQDSLRTWANKRERLQVFASGALFEFSSTTDLEEALMRGLPAVRLSDRLAIVPNEKDVEFRHFRLTGTRDYFLPPDQCVEVDADGVTLHVDLARSDLLLETEVLKFAEPAATSGSGPRRSYRLTPVSLDRARRQGMNLVQLDAWFGQRTGKASSPAARLLHSGAELGSCQVKRMLVVNVPSPELTDGLAQWPETARLIQSRLGPTALVVAEEKLEELRNRCREIGVQLAQEK